MSEKTLLILGAGGHGKAVSEAALLSGEWHRIAFADDRGLRCAKPLAGRLWPMWQAWLCCRLRWQALLLQWAITPCVNSGSRLFMPLGCHWLRWCILALA